VGPVDGAHPAAAELLAEAIAVVQDLGDRL